MFFQCGTTTLNLAPSEFWDITVGEFWAIYDSKCPPVKDEIDREELEEEIEAFRNKYGYG